MRARLTIAAVLVALVASSTVRGQHSITSGSGELVLEAFRPHTGRNGCHTQLGRNVSQPHQRWKIERVGQGSVYRILNRANGLALDANALTLHVNDCRINLWPFHGGVNQLWRIEQLEGDLCRITNVGSGKVLAAHLPAVNRPGCRTQLWDDFGLAHQRWKIPGLFQRVDGMGVDGSGGDVFGSDQDDFDLDDGGFDFDSGNSPAGQGDEDSTDRVNLPGNEWRNPGWQPRRCPETRSR